MTSQPLSVFSIELRAVKFGSEIMTTCLLFLIVVEHRKHGIKVLWHTLKRKVKTIIFINHSLH